MTGAWVILRNPASGRHARHAILGDWQPVHPWPTAPLPHVAMLVGGAVVFGKWSAVNHVWLRWTGAEYTCVWPSAYLDLGQGDEST